MKSVADISSQAHRIAGGSLQVNKGPCTEPFGSPIGDAGSQVKGCKLSKFGYNQCKGVHSDTSIYKK